MLINLNQSTKTFDRVDHRFSMAVLSVTGIKLQIHCKIHFLCVSLMIEVLSGYIHQGYSLLLSMSYVLALVHFQRKLRTNSVLCNYFVSRIQTSCLLLSLQLPRISIIKRTYKTIFSFIHFIKHANVFLYRLNSR